LANEKKASIHDVLSRLALLISIIVGEHIYTNQINR
jgi:hypothetical protein